LSAESLHLAENQLRYQVRGILKAEFTD